MQRGTSLFDRIGPEQMKKFVLRALEESVRVKEQFINEHLDALLETARRLATCFATGHKLLIFGNGGSAADAQHIAAEFVNRFAVERKPLQALAEPAVHHYFDTFQVILMSVIPPQKKPNFSSGIRMG